jgi:hypothetical protein
MREDVGLAWEMGKLRLLIDRFSPEARVRITAYERMCHGPVMAVPGSSSEHKQQDPAVGFILKSRR